MLSIEHTHTHLIPADRAALNNDLIARSWARSQQHGLSRRDRVLFSSPLVVKPGEIREYNRLLLDAAQLEMQRIFSSTLSRDWVLACFDRNGVVIDTLGEINSRTHELGRVFRKGSQQLEIHVGTTAPSCALAERQTVVISRSQHYLDEASDFTCLATPILGPQGDVLGVLDASTVNRTVSPIVYDSLESAARAIERRIFIGSSTHVVFHLHYQQELLGTSREALLAFDANGRLMAANHIARRMLLPVVLEAGAQHSDLFEAFDLSVLGQEHALARPFTLRTHAGVLLCGYVTAADQGLVARQVHPVGKCVPANVPAHGPSDYLEQAHGKASKAYEHGIPLLIDGETGTGKEHFAHRIHQAGSRAAGPFIAVNCSSIPETLIESELFGYAQGAFTGGRKGGLKGKFELAHGGTLFLDEIGDMPVALQARLLRVLQDRKITRLGSEQTLQVDFALICATHKNLSELIDNALFREDLFYRINGLRITLPPLRTRLDLPELIAGILSDECPHPLPLDQPAMQALLRYEWPGNIRQLVQVLKLASVLAADEGAITLSHLPDYLAGSLGGEGQASGEARFSLEHSEFRAIRAAIVQCNGNLSASAKLLGIGRATLYRKLKAMNYPF